MTSSTGLSGSYKSALFVLFVFANLTSLMSQSVYNVRAFPEGEKLVISYLVRDVKEGQLFKVALYSSVDGFSSPIDRNVSGDIGDSVTLRTSNRIEMIDPIATLGDIDGSLTFRVRAQLIYSPATVSSPLTYFKGKRGGMITVGWGGGLMSDEVGFDLYRNEVLLQESIYSSESNTGNARIKLPAGLELGEGYHLKMSLSSLEDPIAFPDFRVKRRISWVSRALMGLVVLSAADYFLNPNSIIYYKILGNRDPLPEHPALPEL